MRHDAHRAHGAAPACTQYPRQVHRWIGIESAAAVDVHEIRIVRLAEVHAGLHHQPRALAVVGAIDHAEQRARVMRRQLALHRTAVVVLVAGHGHPDSHAGAPTAPAPHVEAAQIDAVRILAIVLARVEAGGELRDLLGRALPPRTLPCPARWASAFASAGRH